MSIHSTTLRLAATIGLAGFFVLGSLACSSDSDPTNTSETGFRITVQSLAPEETTQFEIAINTCDDQPVQTAVAPLLPFELPGGIPIQESPLDSEAAHPAADHFFVLDAGCYRATATPQDASGTPIDECAVAESGDLFVEDGRTLEAVLISQCEGAQRGGLDVIGTLNRPPEVDELRFDPAKFVACPQQVEICVDATDPDEDPMRAEWSILSGPTPVTLPTVTESSSAAGQFNECIAFEPGAGAWSLEVKIWDQVNLAGEMTDFEEYFTQLGQPQESNDFLRFPLYGGGDLCVGPTPDAGPDDTDVPDDTEVPDDTDDDDDDASDDDDDAGDDDDDAGDDDAGDDDDDAGDDDDDAGDDDSGDDDDDENGES
jgi:hypothetical protein